MRTKVAIIIERADVGLGGAERSVFEIAEALGLLGLEVHILAAKSQTPALNVHILCSAVEGKRTPYGIFAQALKRHIKDNNYDIIHSVLPFDFADIYQPRAGTYAESVVRNAAAYSNPIVRNFKKLFAFTNIRRSVFLQAERKIAEAKQGPMIIAISRYVADQFQRHYKTSSERMITIPSGIKTDFKPDKGVIEEFRKSIFATFNVKLESKPVLFLFAGNDYRLKGLGCLIKAMQLLLSGDQKRAAYLIVAGRRKFSKYRKLAVKLNVANRILFLDNLNHIHNVLAIVDVAVLPTFQDACSRFILEALACGKPVITTKFNGATDLFTNGRHGLIIEDPANVSALAEALAYFMKPVNIQMASRAIIEDNLRQNISISRVAGQLKEVYDNILSKRGQP